MITSELLEYTEKYEKCVPKQLRVKFVAISIDVQEFLLPTKCLFSIGNQITIDKIVDGFFFLFLYFTFYCSISTVLFLQFSNLA